MKNLYIIALCAVVSMVSGCETLQNAGSAEYHVKPFIDSAGTVTCCEVTVKNGKEIASLEAHITKQGDAYSVDLKEQGVLAFQGQQIAAGAAQSVIAEAARVAIAAALAPILPLLAPAAGAALAAPGMSAAAVGAAGAIAVEKAVGTK